MPNFCEALLTFRQLRRLTLNSLNFNRINESIFIDFLQTAPNLTALCLDNVEISNQFANIIKAVKQSDKIVELRLVALQIQNSAYRLEKLQDFMVNAYHMHKLSLESNKLSNVNFLSQMYQNRSLLELELID